MVEPRTHARETLRATARRGRRLRFWIRQDPVTSCFLVEDLALPGSWPYITTDLTLAEEVRDRWMIEFGEYWTKEG